MNWHEILELKEGASKKEIKNAYRRLAKKYHPDLNPDPRATEKFLIVRRAYEALTDPEKKLEHEQKEFSSTALYGHLFSNIFGRWSLYRLGVVPTRIL